MNGVAIIRALLLAHAPVVVILPDPASVVAGTVPEGVFPAIGIKEIGRVETPTVSMDQANVLVQARVQVTVYAGSYAEQKALLQASKLGPGPHTGVVAGATVRSIIRGVVGPDLSDDAANIYEQSRDFSVTYLEPN